MDNPNPDKVAKVDEIAAKLEAAGTVVVTEYRGLNVPAQAQLRAAIKDAGGEFKIYKNTLTKLAAERTGLDLGDHLTGPTALAFSYPPEGSPADPVALTKALTEFQKDNEALVIKGGVMDGAAINADDVTALSKIAPREELLAEFAGLLQAPMSQFARLLNAMPTKFAALTQALIEKGGAGVADESAAPAQDSPAQDSPAEDAAEDVDAGGVHATDDMVEAAEDAEPGVDAPEQTDAADAATEGAAQAESSDSDEAAASDQTEESADADSEETDDKED